MTFLFYKHILNDFLAFNINTPSGVITFRWLVSLFSVMLFSCLVVSAIKAWNRDVRAGINGKFALAAGINENKTGFWEPIIPALSAVGIIVYAQSYGFYSFITHFDDEFLRQPRVLIGGQVSHARRFLCSDRNVLFGFLVLGLPVANQLMPEGNLSEVIRIIVSNGIILYALTKSQGGKNE